MLRRPGRARRPDHPSTSDCSTSSTDLISTSITIRSTSPGIRPRIRSIIRMVLNDSGRNIIKVPSIIFSLAPHLADSQAMSASRTIDIVSNIGCLLSISSHHQPHNGSIWSTEMMSSNDTAPTSCPSGVSPVTPPSA